MKARWKIRIDRDVGIATWNGVGSHSLIHSFLLPFRFYKVTMQIPLYPIVFQRIVCTVPYPGT